MRVLWSKNQIEKISAELVFVIAFHKAGLQNGDGGKTLDAHLQGGISALIKAQQFEGKEGETLLVTTLGKILPRYVLVVGMGNQTDFSLEAVRRLGGTVATTAKRLKVASIGGVLEPKKIGITSSTERLQAFWEGLLLATYQFSMKQKEEPAPKCSSCCFQIHGDQKALQRAIDHATAIAEGTNLARELTNLPPNRMTPTILAERASALAKEHKSIRVRVLGLKEIKAEKMGGLIAISQGAKEPPTFIHLTYTPMKKSAKKIALVGKGVCFDSGGLNIKTREMELMKIDMGGAAGVLGTFHAAAKLKLPIALEGFIPACENMLSGAAIRPSDIIQMRSGKTVEILNTDAEGRVILGDALDYALECKPTFMIDLATLTGGSAIALGELYTPLLGNDKPLVNRLLAAGIKAGEPSWELPLVKEYLKGYQNGPADLKNSKSGSSASTILGGLFLQEFVGKQKWVHMDIASTSWGEVANSYQPKDCATGNPVRTLIYFLQNI